MSQQFRIDSESLRDKLNSLLPSQARGSINVDLSGQTTIVPIVDLTETAEGSSLRQDLQSSFSLSSSTDFDIVSTTSTIITTTGYFRFFGTSFLQTRTTDVSNVLEITDGTTTKKLFHHSMAGSSVNLNSTLSFDFLVLVKAGESITGTATAAANLARLQGVTRQIADLSQNLTNP